MILEVLKEQTPSKGLFFLDPRIKGKRAREFDENLAARIIGQQKAVESISSLYQLFLAGMNAKNRPIGTLLFLGPTGSGKTRVVEAAAEILFGDPNSVIKIDCAEFQHSHEVAKLIGSPPGYLGHRETSPLLSQENLKRFQTESNPISLVLFDEIEKASDALWQLLLGILDKATLTLGDNRRVDFSNALIVMTSNLGAREMADLRNSTIGFAAAQQATGTAENDCDMNEKIQRTAVQAASRNFSPEFMNRIDSVVVFHSLGEQHLRQILELELHALQQRIMRSASAKFLFHCSDAVKEKLLFEGLDHRYGARHLKRSIEKLLVVPLANLVATGQVIFGDLVYADLNDRDSDIAFSKRTEASLFCESSVAEAPREFMPFIGPAIQSQQLGAMV